MDWADEETENLVAKFCMDDPCAFPKGCTCRDVVKAALRKAKADGMREASNFLLAKINDAAWLLSKQTDGSGWDHVSRASAIEKGME